jgi:uncharacterized membrane protein YdjX (TVP38/TMEM64 family)/thioredoxin reductase
MLPGVLAGLYRPEQALIDLTSLTARSGVALVVDRATGIDPAARRVRRADGEELHWDLLSIDTGATPDTSRVPGAAEHALPLKPIDALLPRMERIIARTRTGQPIAVVGAGAAGTEIALALALRLRAAVTLVAGTSGLLPGFPTGMRRRVARALERRGVALREGQDAMRVSPGRVHFAEGDPLPAEAVIWAAGAAASPWLAETGLRRDARGFLCVDGCLRAAGHADIFAAGDVASFGQGLPKAGVFAVRQGPVLAGNLRAAAEGRAPSPIPATGGISAAAFARRRARHRHAQRAGLRRALGLVAEGCHRSALHGALPGRPGMKWLRDRRLWIALAAVALVLGLRAAGLAEFLSLETLARYRTTLTGLVAANWLLAAGLFVLGYTAAVALSVPGAVWLTLTGGFLFGAVAGTALTVVAATIGATLVFLLARRIFGADALDRLGPRAQRIAEGIRRDAVPYLLVLRLVPVPFFLVNLVPAFCGVRVGIFAATTLVGIIPATAVFSLAGAGLGGVLDAGGRFEIGQVLTPQILGAMLGLAALSLLAIPLKRRFVKD